MLSEMAAEDIKYLEGLGVTLTPGQIVRLNDLALRVTHGKASADFLHAPRVAWIGSDHVFHEPTIAMCMWLRDYAAQWWSGDKMLIATAWASSQCRVRGVFDRHTEKSTAEREIKQWRKSLVCTERQMLAAIMYVIEGDESKPECQVDAEDVLIGGCPYTDRIADAVAAGVGATIEELEAKPIRIVEEIITRWARHQMAKAGAKADVSIRGRNKDFEAYQAYVSELEKGAVKNGG